MEVGLGTIFPSLHDLYSLSGTVDIFGTAPYDLVLKSRVHHQVYIPIRPIFFTLKFGSHKKSCKKHDFFCLKQSDIRIRAWNLSPLLFVLLIYSWFTQWSTSCPVKFAYQLEASGSFAPDQKSVSISASSYLQIFLALLSALHSIPGDCFQKSRPERIIRPSSFVRKLPSNFQQAWKSSGLRIQKVGSWI